MLFANKQKTIKNYFIQRKKNISSTIKAIGYGPQLLVFIALKTADYDSLFIRALMAYE